MRMPAPPVDAYQNITNLGMERVMEGGQTYTVMNFTRPVCSDNDDDIALSEDPYLLYAWGNIANDDVDMIMGHMSTDRNYSEVRFDFICNGKVTATTMINSMHKNNYWYYCSMLSKTT